MKRGRTLKTIRQAKWSYIICSIMLTVVGICIIARPRLSAVRLCSVIGAIVILCGLTKILGYISHDLYNLAFQFDLSLGIFTVAFGSVLLLRAERIIAILPIIIGIFVLIDGVFKLQTAVDAKRFGLSNWWLILIGSLVCVALSLILIFEPFSGSDLIMIFVGISLLVDGLQNLFNAFYNVKITKFNDKNIII